MQIASWLDSSVAVVKPVVEHRAHLPNELVGEAVTHLEGSHLFSCVLTASHKIFWW